MVPSFHVSIWPVNENLKALFSEDNILVVADARNSNTAKVVEVESYTNTIQGHFKIVWYRIKEQFQSTIRIYVGDEAKKQILFDAERYFDYLRKQYPSTEASLHTCDFFDRVKEVSRQIRMEKTHEKIDRILSRLLSPLTCESPLIWSKRILDILEYRKNRNSTDALCLAYFQGKDFTHYACLNAALESRFSHASLRPRIELLIRPEDAPEAPQKSLGMLGKIDPALVRFFQWPSFLSSSE